VSRFRFVADHRHAYGVKRLCEVLEIARSSFYAWLDGEARRAERAAADAELAERIRVVHERDRTQGAPRITAELNDGAPPVARVNHKRVARLMREHGITGLRLRRRVRTTVPEPADQKVPDLLNRDFTADAANQRYVGDITYLPLDDGSNLYLATVIDCFSRRLAGWAIAEHMRTELVADALTAARDTRGSLAGAVFHSDHGSQLRLNRSLQHLDREVCCGARARLGRGSDGQAADAVAGSSAGRPQGTSAIVLGGDLTRGYKYGCRAGSRRVAGPRHAVVPRLWRGDTSVGFSCGLGPVPVVC
jgi:transposase InsO family protein